MTNIFQPPPPEVVARIREFADRSLSPAEFRAYVEAPFAPGEMEENRDLIRWFTTRYPTAGERLAYARRAYARWKRAMPPSK